MYDTREAKSLYLSPGEGVHRWRWSVRFVGLLPSLLILFLATVPAFSAPLFPNQLLSVGIKPLAVASGDLNGGGRNDLISGNCDSGDLSALLQNADGSYQEPITTFIDTCPLAMAISDFNSDGKRDLALATDAGFVLVLRGQGNGQFDLPDSYPVGTSPGSLVMADFNRDGTADLATANAGSDSISVLLALADGTFKEQATYATGVGPQSLSVAYFNQDTIPDLAVLNVGSDDASVFLGMSDGSFQPEQRLATGQYAFTLAVGDFDLDGNQDILANTIIPGLVLLPGGGDGTFGTSIPWDLDGSWWLYLFPGDVNGDGFTDLIWARDFGIEVIIAQGDGTFANWGAFGTGGGGISPLIADQNGDGKMDVVTVDSSSNSLSLLLGDGTGNFGERLFPFVDPEVVPRGSSDILTEDFNNDGKQDLVVLVPGSNLVEYQGNGDGTFHYMGYFDIYYYPEGMGAGDFNHDGNKDLFVAVPGMSAGWLFTGRGNGYFDRIHQPTSTGHQIISGDFDNDNDDDLAMLMDFEFEGGSGGVVLYALLETGSFDFAGAVWTLIPQVSTRAAQADFNSDGKLDLAAGLSGVGGVSVLLGKGDLSFDVQPTIDLPAVPSDIATGDFNGDGAPDIALALESLGKIGVMVGDGTGHFTQNAFDVGGSPFRLALGDFNSDGYLDVVSVDYDSNILSVLTGRGDGSLDPPTRYLGGIDPWAIVTGDFDFDGRLDLAIANSQSQDVSILLNQGPFPVCHDEDGDGYGSPAGPVCTGGMALDCDDTQATVFPGRSEICDGLDNDCDEDTDEGFSDADYDGAADCRDNCVELWNPDQADGDSDGKGDDCEEGSLFADANLSNEGFSSGRVDGRDLAIFADAFGTCPGEAAFNDAANLDRVPPPLGSPGACVGLADFHLFMEQFARSQP